MSMTCYYPFTAVWAGRSLLVATVDGELLMFECLRDVLEDWLSKAGGGDRVQGAMDLRRPAVHHGSDSAFPPSGQ